jgi:hypothetical protein
VESVGYWVGYKRCRFGIAGWVVESEKCSVALYQH